MSTVMQDLHGGCHTLPAGDTRRSDIDSNVDCESDLKKNRLLQFFVVRETILFTKKYCYGTVGLLSICKTLTLTVSAPGWWCTQRPGVELADQLCTVDLQLCKSATHAKKTIPLPGGAELVKLAMATNTGSVLPTDYTAD